MIKDTITYKNKPILTVYHRGFPQEHLISRRSCTSHIEKNLLIFSEEAVADDEWDNLTGYAWEEAGLVMPHEKYNPYHESACAHMVHRIYPNKPPVIWKKDGTTLDEKKLLKILEFIHKYTGMNLEDYPVFLGDAFLFSPSVFKHQSDNENAIILHNPEAGMQIILRLKKGHHIIQSKFINIAADTKELKIDTDFDWDSHDLEIYKNEQLIYIEQDISYARCIQFNLSVAGRRKRIPLTTLQEYYEIEQPGSSEKSTFGTPPEPVQESLSEMNQLLVRRLNAQKASDAFLFIRPGERTIAMKQITAMMFHAVDELWLIDSYFTDKSHGLQQLTDWLRLLTNAQVAKKHLVFYCKSEDNALNAAQLKSSIQKDPIMQDAMLSRPLHTIQLIQTTSPIHDRFLITRNGDIYSGLSIGTSFNSLNSNHYCIYKLAHREAKEILDVLCAWMHDNISAQEECTYDNR